MMTAHVRAPLVVASQYETPDVGTATVAWVHATKSDVDIHATRVNGMPDAAPYCIMVTSAEDSVCLYLDERQAARVMTMCQRILDWEREKQEKPEHPERVPKWDR